MGSSFSWIAVADLSPEESLDLLNLTDTGRYTELGDCEIAGAQLENGVYVIVMKEFWHRIIHPSSMEEFTGDCTVIGCSEYEAVNTSLAFQYKWRKEIWHVSHILDEGRDHLSIGGQPPSAIHQLLNEARKKSAEDGGDAVFDVPAKLAEQLCGYEYRANPMIRFRELLPMVLLPGAQIVESLRACVVSLLSTLGFIEQYRDDDLEDHVATTDQDEIVCRFSRYGNATGGGFVSISFKVRNNYVQKLTLAGRVLAPDEWAPEWTYVHDEFSELPCHIRTKEDMAAWLAEIKAKLPELVARLHSIKELDQLANNGGALREVSAALPMVKHCDFATGISRLVLAYLAGNPNFQRMVDEVDADYDDGPCPSNPIHKKIAFLKENGKPIN